MLKRRAVSRAWLAAPLVTISAALILCQGASQAATSYIAATPAMVVVPAGSTQGTTSIAWGTSSPTQGGLVQEDHGGSKTIIGGPSWVGVVVATVLCGQPNNFTLVASGTSTVLAAISVPVSCKDASPVASSPAGTTSPTAGATATATPTAVAVTATATPTALMRSSATPCSMCTATPTATSPSAASMTATGGPASGPEHIAFGDAPSPALLVSYPAGWSIVAGPSGTALSGYVGPLYTYQPGDTDYAVLGADEPLVPSEGYWAYFGGTGYQTVPLSGSRSITLNLPALQWVMIGNSRGTSATVTGADAVYVYAPTTGYVATSTLSPGQGAWAFSSNGGSITISSN
jgi:hypothetical protein